MTKENNKVDFDLSALTFEELIEVYEKIENFLEYLDDSRVEIEEKSGEDE